MSIKTEYRGFELSMLEETEAWACSDLEISYDENLGLRSIKARIDKMFKDDRKLGDLKVLKLSGGAGRFRDRVQVVEVTATLLCAPQMDYHNGRREQRIKSCWVTDEKGERIKCALSSLYPVEFRPQIEAWRKLVDEAEAAIERADEAEKAIPAFNTAEAMMKAAREAQVRKADAEA